MKKTFLFLLICLLGSGTLWAQNGKTPFKGTIQYKLKYNTSEQQIPATQLRLHRMPQARTIKMTDTKLFMDNKVMKTILNADEKMMYTLINLSQMGLGKYRIKRNEAQFKDTSKRLNFKVNITEETKLVQGYTAQKAEGSYTTAQAEIQFTAWFVKGFCSPFLYGIEDAFVQLPGFPLEYTMKMKNTADGESLTTDFVIERMTYEEIDPKEFNISKSYQEITKENLEKMIQELTGAKEQ